MLILSKGNWNGNQIMTYSAYFNQKVNISQPLYNAYGYLWWLNGEPPFTVPSLQVVFTGTINPSAPSNMIEALGLNGKK